MTGAAIPPAGAHGGDGEAVAVALGIDPADLLDLSASMNPCAADPLPIIGRHLRAGLDRYPNPERATAALADTMGVHPAGLLLTNGGAEAISLLAAEIGGRVVEPAFALHPREQRPQPPLQPDPRAGGARQADRADREPRQDSGRPADSPRRGTEATALPLWRANPDSPSGLLAAPAEAAGVWDEAFYPLATGSWTRGDAGVPVVGSLTKLLSAPGLRVGYVLAEPELVAACRRRQPGWSVNGLVCAALPDLLAAVDLAATARGIAALRADLAALLAGYGLTVRPSDANWLLVEAPGLRERLAPHGVLVRDCAGFGLPGIARIAVPDERGLERLDQALAAAFGHESTSAATSLATPAPATHDDGPSHGRTGGTTAPPAGDGPRPRRAPLGDAGAAVIPDTDPPRPPLTSAARRQEGTATMETAAGSPFEAAARAVRPADVDDAGARADARQDRLTKPRGALGRLEGLGSRLAAIARTCPPPVPERAAVCLFAADHGVLAQGVSPWPREVTAQMVANICAGGAAVTVLARELGADVIVTDVGVATPIPIPSQALAQAPAPAPTPPPTLSANPTPSATPAPAPAQESPAVTVTLHRQPIAPGTADLSQGPAMTEVQARQALDIGARTARDAVARGARVLITGEMGIGNTTPAAALIAAFTGLPAAEVTGRGTGIDDATLARKTEVIRRAVARLSADASPIEILCEVGGFEIAALAGLIVGGAAAGVPVLIDGAIAASAALVACAAVPAAQGYLIAGHRSVEPGSGAALRHLHLAPLLDLDLRLGEGTGALLALPLVRSAARVLREMATFDDAAVTEV